MVSSLCTGVSGQTNSHGASVVNAGAVSSSGTIRSYRSFPRGLNVRNPSVTSWSDSPRRRIELIALLKAAVTASFEACAMAVDKHNFDPASGKQKPSSRKVLASSAMPASFVPELEDEAGWMGTRFQVIMVGGS